MKNREKREAICRVLEQESRLSSNEPGACGSNRVLPFFREWMPEEHAEGRNSGNRSSAGFAPCNSGSGDEVAGGIGWMK